MKLMYILRGLPGSGKSTLANEILASRSSNGVIISADHVWEIPYYDAGYIYPDKKLYDFHGELLGFAHKITQLKARKVCELGIETVIIDNTNTQFKEMQPYIDIAEEFDYSWGILEPGNPNKFDVDWCFNHNTHNVPKEAIQRMKDRWEYVTDGIVS